jgi:hypothetical protein
MRRDEHPRETSQRNRRERSGRSRPFEAWTEQPWRPEEYPQRSRSGYRRDPYPGSSGYEGYGSGYNEQMGGPADREAYWSRGRGHRGRGPKNYNRTDERIREDICDRLTDDDDVDATLITIEVKDGEVTLLGTVEDRMMKHRAENCAANVSGVRDVNNQLRTKRRSERNE